VWCIRILALSRAVVSVDMQFLVEWYQLSEMQSIVQLAVSRRAVSSTVVSADMQFLVVVSTELQFLV